MLIKHGPRCGLSNALGLWGNWDYIYIYIQVK